MKREEAMGDYTNLDLNQLAAYWLILQNRAERSQKDADKVGLALVRRFKFAQVLGADTDTHRVTLSECDTLQVTRLEDL